MFDNFKNWLHKKKWFRKDRSDHYDEEPDSRFDDADIKGDFEDDYQEPKLLSRVKDKLKRLGSSQKWKLPKSKGGEAFDIQNIELKSITQYSTAIRWVLVVLAIFLASRIVTEIISLSVRPAYTPMPRRASPSGKKVLPKEDYGSISRRNMFNVEGTIPEPFDQGMLDCFSQAKPSSQPLTLLGTIVMRNEKLSVALVQQGGKAEPEAVRKDESFFDKYTALKVDRKRLCFQVRSSQNLEYIEVKDDTPTLSLGAPSLSTTGGITATSENSFSIKRSFLDDKLGNLNEILQSARAVPYIDAQGNFSGFLIQTIREDSVFYDLGVRQGDVLNAVNDIKLDNAGKGLEAFQRLKQSPQVQLEITRGGQSKTLNYAVQ